MIYLRDDDVLVGSSGHEDSFKKFQQVHRWICETDKLLHIPAILVTEIQAYPECIAYIKEETRKGRMSPEIHGYKHIDYGKLSYDEVVDHLRRCKNFIGEQFDITAKTWYTPWGANSPTLQQASAECGLILVDCSNLNKLNGRYGVIQEAKEGKNIAKLFDKKEIFYHWWQGGLRLKRMVEILKHGSIEAAMEHTEGIF
jgi:peptidoglycan/xylan/chitin deacetylase (PgdA/CDA1 family)